VRLFFKFGLVIAAAFAFVLLASWAMVQFPACRFVLWPGAAIADSWLHVSIWQPMFGLLAFTLDVLIYSTVFGLALWLLRRIVRKKD
jgi:hypothetical protein